MVESSLTEDDRRTFSLVARVGFVALLALSAALIAVNGDAAPGETALVAAAGGLFGLLLVLYFRWADWAVGARRRGRW